MKARKVKRLDPQGALADNMERIVRVRLSELCDFMPRAGHPDRVEALHDMRIAAKRLRYILEIAHPCFGDYATTAVRLVRELQDLLGEIHDCDVQIEEVADLFDRLRDEDARALAGSAAGLDSLDAGALGRTPNQPAYAGLAALPVYLRARRQLLFEEFREAWEDLQRKGFRARLEYAVSERPSRLEAPPPEEREEEPGAEVESESPPVDPGAAPSSEPEELSPSEPEPEPEPELREESAPSQPEPELGEESAPSQPEPELGEESAASQPEPELGEESTPSEPAESHDEAQGHDQGLEGTG